jgi:hypothetical protein
MNWSKVGAVVLLVSVVDLVSCLPHKPSATVVTVPSLSAPDQLKAAQDQLNTAVQQKPQVYNGIYLEGVKVYDEAALESLLSAARTNLAQLNGFDQASLIGHLGAIQGSTANQSQNALQVTGPPQWGGVTPTSPNTPNNPTLPAPSATYTLPSTFQTSAADFLNEQMQLSMQMINLQLLLGGSFNDQYEHDSNIARIRTTLGFPINISVPPGFKYQGAVAEVDISVCAPDTVSTSDLASNGGLSLVTLLPQEKTYNVASLVSKASSVGGGVVAGVVNVGGGILRSRQTYYLVQDTDTLALQRVPQDNCRRSTDPNDTTKPVAFAWQFRPVLGQKVVRDGLRQTFAQVSFPRDVSSNSRSPLRILVRTGWRHYDARTGRVGNEIDPFNIQLLKADRFHLRPCPQDVQANDNGDGTVTVLAMGAFKAGTRVRIGGVVQDSTVSGFEQNQRYLKFIAPASSLGIYSAYLLNQDGVEAEVVNEPPDNPRACESRPRIPSQEPAILILDSIRAGQRDQHVRLMGLGTHFTRALPTATFAAPGITVSNLQVDDDTHLTMNLAVEPYVPTGPMDANVVTGSETARGRGVLTVIPSEYIACISLTPSSRCANPVVGQQGQTSHVVITGAFTTFTQGSPTVSFGAPGITVSNLVVNDDTHLSMDLTVAPTTPPGPTDVNIITGSATASGAGLFTVQGVARIEPFNDSTSLVKITLPRYNYSPRDLEMVVIGSHVLGLRDAPFYMRSDDELQFLVTNDLIRANRQILWKRLFTYDSQTYRIIFPPLEPTGISDFAVTGVTLVSYTAGSAGSASPGASVASNVIVSTASETATGPSLFTVGNGTPSITSVSQASAQPGETLRQVVITGEFTHFMRATPSVTLSNPGVVVGNVSVLDDTHLSADFTVTPLASKVASNITVRAGSEVAVGGGLFAVGSGTALIAGVIPASGDRSQAVNVTITGTSSRFVQGQSTVKLSKAGVEASNVAVIDGTHLTATFTIAANAVPGSSTVTVVTGSDKAVGTGSFTVAPSLPSIARVSPAAGQQGQTINGVAITGTFTHFTLGPPAVTFSNPGITATNVVVSDDTHLTATLNIAANAAAAASSVSDTSNASPKATNTYAIVGSRLSGLRIVVPAGVPINEPRADTLVTFSLTDDQAKAYKSIVVQHNTDQLIVVALPAPPAAPGASSTPAPKPSCKKPATGIPIGMPSVTLAGTGMSQVVDVRYLDAPLVWTSSSDTSLTIQQLPTLVPPGIELTFVLGDRSMVSCFVPVQAPGAN